MRLPTLPRPAPTLCSARSPVSPESCIAECMHATRLQLCSSPASRLLLACYWAASGEQACIHSCVARLCRPVVLSSAYGCPVEGVPAVGAFALCLLGFWFSAWCGLRLARRSGPLLSRLLPPPKPCSADGRGADEVEVIVCADMSCSFSRRGARARVTSTPRTSGQRWMDDGAADTALERFTVGCLASRAWPAAPMLRSPPLSDLMQPAFDLQNIDVCRGLSRMRKTAPAVEPRVIGLSIVTPKVGWI